MIKYLFILLSSFSVAIMNYIDMSDVEITHNIPDVLVPGEVYDIDIAINKGDIGGFAKLQITIPNGINVKAVETQNSSFTYKSNVIKNIWMKVPEESEILLSYKFEVSPEFRGSANIEGKFVFIMDNERLTIDMEPKLVKAGEPGSASSVVTTNSSFTPEKLHVKRHIKAMGNNEFDVHIVIEKDGLEGFAKIQDVLPEGFEAKPMRTSQSVFSVVENKVKFIWFNVPPEEKIEISYILISKYPVNDGVKLNGSFSYLFNDEALQLDLPEENLYDYIDVDERIASSNESTKVNDESISTEKASEVVSETKVVSPTLTTTPTPAKTVVAAAVVVPETKIEKVEPIKEEPILVEEATTTMKVEPVKEVVVSEAVVPNANVFYRVQLSAGKSSVDVNFIKKRHSFWEEIYLENHEGWYKYTSGNYSVYKKARDRREDIRRDYEFDGPFVTAYNAGERISVQEALLITKQKWMK